MPKVTAATVAVTGLLLIALTGCAGEAGDAAEADYLAVIEGEVDRPTEELLEAGHAACEQILDGRDIFQVHVLADDTKADGFYRDSVRVALAAAPRLCPDLD